MTLLEAVVQTADDAVAAERAGARRLELCVCLEAGGVTPPPDLITAAAGRVSIPVFVMIRPRDGDFVCSDDEFAAALRDVDLARACGARGIVTGFLLEDGRIDLERTRRIVRRAGDLPVTFHRAFDDVPDQTIALEEIIGAGVRRVLTSGAAPSALDGADRIAELVRQAGDRVTVLAGGGVRPHNVRELVRRTRVSEVHARFESEAGTRALAGLL